jgi:phosphonate transport system ATP-binding protein
MPILSVRDLNVRYAASGPEILKGVSFDVEEEDFFAIIGPSGAGKSTLIRCINRLVEPTSGEIFLYGSNILSLGSRDLRRVRRGIGMIFQEFNLVDRMSVMDNVLSGRLGYVGNLTASGGQRQRVGIARALMQDPKLLLLDEPTSSLDPKIAREILGMIKEIAAEFGVPVLCNIHDVQLAMEYCNKIIGLQDGVKMFDGPTETMNKERLDEIYAMEVL